MLPLKRNSTKLRPLNKYLCILKPFTCVTKLVLLEMRLPNLGFNNVKQPLKYKSIVVVYE